MLSPDVDPQGQQDKELWRPQSIDQLLAGIAVELDVAPGDLHWQAEYETWLADQGRSFTRDRALAIEAFKELLVHPVYYGVGIPHGNGRPTLVLPDALELLPNAEMVMVGWLQRIGYKNVHEGVTYLPDLDGMVPVFDRLVDVGYQTYGRPLTLIGHGFGGSIARVVAQKNPGKVDTVVALGSRLVGDQAALREEFAHTMSGLGGAHADGVTFFDRLAMPLASSTRLISLFSRADPVVFWRESADPQAEQREVDGGHAALLFNPTVYQKIGRILLRP